MKTKLIFLCLMSAISTTAIAAGHAHQDNDNRRNVMAASSKLALPALAARFELHAGGRGADWFLIRDARRVANFNSGSRQGEIWMRDEQGRMEYTRVFAEDKKVLDYTDGQLKTLSMQPDWAQLASILSPDTLSKLHKTGERKVLGQRAVVLEGKIEGVRTRLWWLAELQLPARLERGTGKSATQLVLRELHGQAPAAWNWANNEVIDSYARLDATDLGDMEYDPFVQKVMNQDGHHHGHEH